MIVSNVILDIIYIMDSVLINALNILLLMISMIYRNVTIAL